MSPSVVRPQGPNPTGGFLFKIAMEVLIAARLGDTETASALLAAGADVNGRNDQGCVTAARV